MFLSTNGSLRGSGGDAGGGETVFHIQTLIEPDRESDSIRADFFV